MKYFKCCGFRIKKHHMAAYFLLLVIVYFLIAPMREGLTNNLPDQVLMGIGADYSLAAYTGSQWNPIKTPTGLAKPMIRAITLGPDNNLYAVGTDSHLYINKGGVWVRPRQPTATELLSITTENDALVCIGSDFKLYSYDIPTATLNPLPGNTGDMISTVVFEGNKLGVGKDNNLYRWVNNKWGRFTDSTNLANIAVYNKQLVGVSTDNTMYTYEPNKKPPPPPPPTSPDLKGKCWGKWKYVAFGNSKSPLATGSDANYPKTTTMEKCTKTCDKFASSKATYWSTKGDCKCLTEEANLADNPPDGWQWAKIGACAVAPVLKMARKSPGKHWTPLKLKEERKVISVYALSHDLYDKFGFT